MPKPLDYPDLWDSFTEGERRAMVLGVPGADTDLWKRPWDKLPVWFRQALLKLDWEFMLGKRF